MPRPYKDLIVDETDGKVRVDLVNRDGTIAMRDVAVRISSRVLQEGDSFGALATNLLLEIDDDGTPIKRYPKTFLATIGTAWSAAAPFTQTIAVSGLTAADTPLIDVVLSGTEETDLARIEAWGMVGRIVTAANSITITCYEEKPRVEIPIQIKVVN